MTVITIGAIFQLADTDIMETMMEATTVITTGAIFQLADTDIMETMMEATTLITTGANFQLADMAIMVTTMEVTTVTTIGANFRVFKTPTLKNKIFRFSPLNFSLFYLKLPHFFAFLGLDPETYLASVTSYPSTRSTVISVLKLLPTGV